MTEDGSDADTEKRRDEVLRRMLNTPPKQQPIPKPGPRPGEAGSFLILFWPALPPRLLAAICRLATPLRYQV